MNPQPFLFAAAFIALTNWIAILINVKGWDPVSKPGVILALITALSLVPGPDPFRRWILTALIFSLVGDIFLLIPERFFFAGLLSFLLAHGAYIAALNPDFPPSTPFLLFIFLGNLTLSLFLFQRLYQALHKQSKLWILVPLALYTAALTGTWFSGISFLFREGWEHGAGYLIAAGGSLFYLSDSLLAWHRFISPIPDRDLKVRISYHLAQCCLVGGAILHLGR